ncbi:NAD-glutamate dehydrogenase [Rhodococcus sp. HNM0569]|uniref:NAD-glutamate dehydrogenase n=1 Tax=Rhodococcus sp. HNM0569 TaxID=2716340 RepID=UPI00146F3C33|nr:NAD-glutamate dehydrogenase [Rhodococcus sp. HNM0569]NLU83993.1 NAD-glutamate dehydrogenase [Rhodococcus sp. HNM0569]
MTETARPHRWVRGLPPTLRPRAEILARNYFRHIDQGDSDNPVNGSADTVLAEHLELGRERRSDEIRVRVSGTGDPSGLGPALQVVVEDMPFLVESLIALLERLGISVAELVHPILSVQRDVRGTLANIVFAGESPDPHEPPPVAESWTHFQLEPQTASAALERLAHEVVGVVQDVRAVVHDTASMRELELTVADEVSHATLPSEITDDDRTDCAELLRWMAEDNYAVLGYSRLEFGERAADGRRSLAVVPGSGLGLLRRDRFEDRAIELRTASRERDHRLMVLTQGSTPATVHRVTYPYFVGVSIFDAHGTAVGEHRFLGVFTVSALHENVLDIPLVGRRVRKVIARAGHDLGSYSGQAILATLEDLPTTELFSSNTDTLLETVGAVRSVGLRRQVRLFVREDRFGRFVSCLVYLPRDRYTTPVRLAMLRALSDAFGGGTVDYTVRVTEGALAMLHVTVRKTDGAVSEPPHLSPAARAALEQQLTDISRNWADRLADAVATRTGVDGSLVAEYAQALPDAYKEDFEAERALEDISRVAALTDGAIDVRLACETGADDWHFSLFVGGGPVSLGQVLPVLQSLGVDVRDERPYSLVRPDGLPCRIYDFGLDVPRGVLDGDSARVDAFTATFAAVWEGRAEADRFNELVLCAGLAWRQATVLRAYAKYLRQAAFPYSQYHIEGILVAHPDTTRMLAALFEAQFDPDGPGDERVAELETALSVEIGEVVSLDADRVLRALLGLVRATLRTNYFRCDTDGRPLDYLSLKLDPHRIDELPFPRPKFEIFVYSPTVEGVHLRFGDVARGGLRWSDRREDFRTEILGLAKAQAVKNAVIVPSGAKGGFVVKHSPPATGDAEHDRATVRDAGVAAYRTFVCGLLDITDDIDLATNTVRPPGRVLRRDGDDTYLVVAADKGTAGFSDLANSVAAQYGYWLGDAFASGGSTGYDHKALGITARGAWVSVQRHFREMGVDPAREDFTVVGIGDMSGDVFGNGMLLSEHIRLVAAFDHRHVFLDPDPDSATSFAERQRLFRLPRSSWDDYDRAVLSDGGGVWPRTVKSIPIAPAARAALGLAEDVVALSPPDLVRAVLRAPVQLLWNGGIGTYVKGSDETHADVGDKSNDAVRVDAVEVRASVIGEGGNLGVTPRGRVEYARAGGRINTDAVDNSAGVDSSDHEVNIKILLDSAVGAGALAPGERNPLLASMSDEVAVLVLDDNRSQNELLGLSRANAAERIDVQRRQIDALVESGEVDRELDVLPDDDELARRSASGGELTSPELATLMAHVKLALERDLLATELPDSDTFAATVPRYFPTPLRDRFAPQIARHPLRRQIVATMLANDTIDTGGITYAFRLAEDVGASGTDAVRAHTVVTSVFDIAGLRARVRARRMPAAAEGALVLETGRLLDRASRWFLGHRPQPVAVGAEVTRYAGPVAVLTPLLDECLREVHRDAVVEFARPAVDAGAPEDLAHEVYRQLYRFAFLDIADLAEIAERDLHEVADLYFALDAHFGVGVLLRHVSQLPRGDRWHSLARLALRDDLYGSVRQLTREMLAGTESHETAAQKIEDWESRNRRKIDRARSALTEIFASGTLDLATLSVAARQVRSMVRE